MSVTSDIDLSVLWECYQLEPYHGLRKPCDEDTITTTHDGSEKVSHSSFKQNTPPPCKSPQESSTVSIVEVEENKDDETEHTIQQTEQSSLSSIKNETSIQQSSVTIGGTQFDQQSSSYHDNIYSFHHGPSNAISVQLFCMDEQYEMRSIDLIPAVFEIFPDRDFLILSQPHNILEFPLLQHFTHVTPRLDSTISQDLYILHKCSLLNSFHVHPMEEKDIKGVNDLTSSLDAQNDIMIDVERYLQGGRDPLSENATPLHVLVAECLEQIVGVVILRQEENLEYLRSHYNIEDYVYYSQHTPQEHMTVHHLLINPIFAPHLKHFMKEAMRLTHSNNLYYPVPLHDIFKSHPHSLTLALGEMVPIRPRRQVCYPDDLGINVPCSGVMEKQPLYTLYHTNRKLSMEPKIVINSRLVFIGASDASLAALETIVFSPHLRFNNLILVSPNGLLDSSYSSVLPNSCCFYNGALRGIGLEVWVNVVKGVLTAIKRESREINVLMSDKSEESILPYDYLILSTGLQYCIDEPGHGDIPEKGVFTLQGDTCDEKVLEKTKELIANNGKVVVYGSSIVSLSLLAHLLDMMKVPGSQMTWIQPHPFTVMKDSIVNDKIQDGVDKSGMNVIHGYKIEKYESFDGELTGLMCVNEEKGETISLDCRVVFCLETREVDKKAFKAINDSCLVYDNRVVIDSQHFTNDTHILAMGSVTKYSRRYRTQWSHDHFNASEVGQKLAATILSKLDPTLHPLNTPPQNKYLIPIYSQPKVLYTRLPGGLYYLQIEKPHFDEIKEPNEGMEVFTNTENGYFRLYINQYERIQTITILSHQEFEVSNYMCLYNIHEKYLNNLLSGWKENLINDLFIYFREQWTCAIFHDRFIDFTSEVKELLSEPQGDEPSLMDKTKDIIDDSAVVSVEANCEKFLGVSNDLEKVLNKRLHRYIHHNGYHLPMYARPDML